MDNRNTSSSSSSQSQNQSEEETTNFYRSSITSRISTKNNIVTERFSPAGISSKPGGKSAAIVAIQENREREKRELSHLNDRFASYIERVRFLEVQNKKLQFEIDHLRGKWGLQTNKVKEKYDAEIHQARHIIDDTAKDRAAADLRAKRAAEEMSKLKDKYELLLAARDSDRQKIALLEKQLFDNQADLDLYHRRLIDLEDEQKLFHMKSQTLILDIQRITKDLDHETLTRIQLENQKQSLEEEIHFLKEIHLQDIEDLKQTNLISTTLDPTNLFKHELSNVVTNMREEYEQLNYQQQNELQSWYQSKVTQAIQEIQSYRAIEKAEQIHEREEIRKLQTIVSDSQEDIVTMRQRNEVLENRIRELEELIQIERRNNIRASDERDCKIRDLRVHLEDLGREYDEVVSTKSSLDSEIAIYRKLLEGEEKREGLKQIVENVEEQARTNSFVTGESTTNPHSRSYQRTGGKQGFDNNDSMLTSYEPFQPLPSTRTESTIFEQVYGCYRRRPLTSISLNVQWVPTVDRSSTYKWNTNDIDSRKLKTETFFETSAMREQQQPKAVTSPSSDYTDAYLAAFAPKPIHTRRIRRITTPVSATVAPIRTHLSTNRSIRTSQTRFNTINNIRTSNLFDKTVSPFPSSSSTYLSSLIPDISPKYEPFSSQQSSSSETQTYNSNHSTSPRNLQSSETTIHTSLPVTNTTYRSKSSYENVHKPMPPFSLQTYPSLPITPLSPSSIILTYKPSVSFQPAPLSFSNNIHQSSTNDQIVLPSSNSENQIDRPETLLFQHDEDMRSSCIEKPSPIITPLLESPVTYVESKIEPERTSTEELLVASSKPIGILENTISKYDTTIDQISEILASVSPLSSTVNNSMSPGKSVLDYELSSNGSPILQHKRFEAQSSEQSTTPVTNSNIQHVKSKYLIRRDSYDKIATAIADLDSEMTPPLDIQTSTTIIEEEKEEPITPSLEDHQMLSSSDQLKDEIDTLPFDKHQISSTSPLDILTNELPPLDEIKLDEKKFVDIQPTTETPSNLTKFIQQQQIDLLSDVPTVEMIQEEISESHDDETSNKKNAKHMMWGETMVNNEDKESLSHHNFTEENSSSEALILVADKKHLNSAESIPVIEQQISASISIEKVVIDDHTDLTSSIEPSSNVDEQQIESSSLVETLSNVLDIINRLTTSSDLNESRSNNDEQSTIILDVVSKANMDLEAEEIDSNKSETTPELVDATKSETRISTNESTALLPLSVIESPVNTLTDAISTRYISSDVYHGYLGDHTQFIQSPLDIDAENRKISLLASLRQMIVTPATPLIETIQSVVSNMRTLTATQSLKNENETRLTTTMITNMTEENNDHGTQIEENKSTAHAFEESKAAFERLHDTIMEPEETITSNLQAEKQGVLLMSSNEQVEPISEILISTEDVKDFTTLDRTLLKGNTSSFIEKLDDHSTNEIELTPSSTFNSTQENVSNEITSLTNTNQNVVSEDLPSIQTQALAEQILESFPFDPLNVSGILTSLMALLATPANEDEEQTISDTDTITIEQNHDNAIVQSPSSKILTLSLIENNMSESVTTQPDEQFVTERIEAITVDQKSEDLLSAEDKTTESIMSTPIVQDGEEVLTTNAILLERSDDTGDKEEITQIDFASDASDVTTFEQKTDDIEISLNDTAYPLATITEKIDSIISILPTEENLPLVEQDFAPTNDYTNAAQIMSTETIPDQLSLSQEKALVVALEESDSSPKNQILDKEKDELMSASNEDNKVILKTINEIIQTALSQLQQNSIAINQEIPSSDSGLTQPTIPHTSVDLRELSPTNTELDSLELIHALQGHSIILPNPSEKSSSTTTSSQITSSDRYISYAIHQMGDSSQERLPAIPISADIPIYKNIEENVLIKPLAIANQSVTKEDDSTEFDATENLTSYSDDILLRRLQTSATIRQKNFDASSTDEDVDDEIEQHDLTDLDRIIDKLTQPSPNKEDYQRYDLATTPSSNDSSSSSKQQPDDVYFIPGYAGLWRPSADNDNANLQIDYDADDERRTAAKTRTIVRTINSTKRPLLLQQSPNQSSNLTHPGKLASGIRVRPNTIDISESDSYHTCPSSISKQEKQCQLNKSEEEHQTSPNESIFLIRRRERGISLPVIMKINCDDIALRLSTSTPIDTQLYSTIQSDLSSPSTHSEPLLPEKTDSNSRASSPSLSHNENDPQKLPSWLNTVNTIITTTEGSDGPLESRITVLKSAKGPISISECHPQGHYIIIENTSRSKNIDLTNWKIHQENDHGDNLIFTFPDHYFLRANHSLKILTKTNQSEQRNDDLIASSISLWHTTPNILTTLINPEGKDCATLTKKTIFS